MRLRTWDLALLAVLAAQACSSSRPIAPEPAPSPSGADASTDSSVVAPRPYRAIALSVGDVSTCVILEDHQVKCWGTNSFGELGTGDEKARGALPEEMGDALPTVDLGAGRAARQISVGHYGACALLDDGGVKCWGFHTGIPDALYSPVGDGMRPLPVPEGRRVVSITCGHNFPIGILDDGTGVVWSDRQAKIPDFQTTSRLKQATRGLGRTVVLFEDGTSTMLWAPLDAPPAPSLPFGSPASSVIGDEWTLCARLVDGRVTCQDRKPFPPALTDPVALAVGTNAPHCALLTGGVVRCWGGNFLGCNVDDQGLSYWCDGQAKDEVGGVDVRLPSPAVALSGGSNSTCALLADGSVWCWGSPAQHVDPNDTNSPFQASLGVDATHPAWWLGATVAITTDATGRRVFAGWRAIDLGTHR